MGAFSVPAVHEVDGDGETIRLETIRLQPIGPATLDGEDGDVTRIQCPLAGCEDREGLAHYLRYGRLLHGYVCPGCGEGFVDA